MATVVSQLVHHLSRHLGFFKKFILRKTAANFTDINRKHVFASPTRNTVKNRVKKMKLQEMLSKLQFPISSFFDA